MGSLYKIESVCSLRLSRMSVFCGTIGLSQYRTRALVVIYGSGTRRAWGREGLSWSLPSIFPLPLPTSKFPPPPPITLSGGGNNNIHFQRLLHAPMAASRIIFLRI